MARSAVYFALILAVSGWAAAGAPFRGDQALFADSARRLAGGAVLYRDVWDVTNPGVFAFYAAAGSVFGWSEDGIHVAEWLWWAAFAVCVAVASKRKFEMNTLPLAPAVILAGGYFLTAAAEPSHLTKAEGLAGFPLFLAAWLAAGDRRWWRMLSAGFCGGSVILLKMAFAPMLLAVWVPALLTMRASIRELFLLVVGFAAPLAAAVGYFAGHGAVNEAFEVLFVAPRQMMAAADPAGFDRLAASARWYTEVGSGTLALAAFGAWSALRRGRDSLVWSYAALFPAAAGVILVQRWSWWSYHFILLQTAGAVLAAYTWPAAVAAVRAWGPPRPLAPVVLALSLVFLPVLGHGAYAYSRLLTQRFGATSADRDAARAAAGKAYAQADAETKWLAEAGAKPGPIFVAGDPLYLWRSGRPAATAHNGWSLELFAPPQWQALADELRAARPAYVFVSKDDGFDRLIAERGAAVAAWLAAEYRPVRSSARGVWHGLKE